MLGEPEPKAEPLTPERRRGLSRLLLKMLEGQLTEQGRQRLEAGLSEVIGQSTDREADDAVVVDFPLRREETELQDPKDYAAEGEL